LTGLSKIDKLPHSVLVLQMARSVPLPKTDYIVFHTHYTGRFEDPARQNELIEILKEYEGYGVVGTPLYVYDTICGHGLTTLSSTHHPVEISNLQDIIRQVAPDCSNGIIVFKADDFQACFSLYQVLRAVRYCKLSSLDRIEAIEANVNGTDVGIIRVRVGSESG
jgi:hypothetical protein